METVDSSQIANGPSSQESAPVALPTVLLRVLLFGGCVVALAAGIAVGHPESYLADDLGLARLLRGMAVIKAAIVLPVLALLWWRFGLSVPRRIAVAYLAGFWLMAGATMMIWQLTYLRIAAVTFHVGLIVLLGAMWRDRTHAQIRVRSF